MKASAFSTGGTGISVPWKNSVNAIRLLAASRHAASSVSAQITQIAAIMHGVLLISDGV